ncbi:MAG: hypothetical protein CMF74_02025 [Maricaulis sp.]|nr:hypothetical protein [Maricaulis sp.]
MGLDAVNEGVARVNTDPGIGVGEGIFGRVAHASFRLASKRTHRLRQARASPMPQGGYSRKSPMPTGVFSVRFILAALAFAVSAIATPAQADTPFTVTGVEIDASGANALEAQTVAMREGQVAATRVLLNRLTLPEDRGSIPPIGAETAASLITGLQVSNEQRSSTRYLGDLTVNFSAGAVRRFLNGAGVPFVDSQARETLILPVLRGSGGLTLWDGNPWLETWRTGGFTNALTPVRAPDGDAGRMFVDAASAANFDTQALADIAQGFGVSSVAVIIASGGEGGVSYEGAILEFDGTEVVNNTSVSGSAGSYSGAASRVVDDLESAWKRQVVVRGGSGGELRVTVLYRSIDQWRSVQNALTGASLISNARLDAVSRTGAMMTLTYRGTTEQLRRELDARGAVLGEDPELGITVSPR